jgi:hypothetical protein
MREGGPREVEERQSRDQIHEDGGERVRLAGPGHGGEDVGPKSPVAAGERAPQPESAEEEFPDQDDAADDVERAEEFGHGTTTRVPVIPMWISQW